MRRGSDCKAIAEPPASRQELTTEALEFIKQYADDEEKLGRYSAVFGTDLLPGMYSMPLYAVPKADTGKLRLVNDHSAGDFALNMGIDKDDVGMRQDNIQDLGTHLLSAREDLGNIPLWLFKSDVSNAYRLLPMHPLWQIRQIITVDGERRVDRCCCFGSRGSPDLWCSFMSLVLWIAVNVKDIAGVLAYMDDTFSVDPNPTLLLYAPYNSFFPSKQTRLLQLWDELGIPHKPEKQLFGRSLTIIGLHVDSDAMTVALPHDKRLELVDNIRSFVQTENRRRTLREWQRLLDWINWGLNVEPLLRPGLQSAYAKIRGKQFPRATVYLNNAVRQDLTWIADRFAQSDGVHLFTARAWGPAQASLTLFCDASLSGMGFWCPARRVGFAAERPSVAPRGLDDHIFWYEALTVAAAVEWASRLPAPPLRLAVYTDNMNTVQMFDSLRAMDGYNDILRFACGIMSAAHIDVRVWHVPGADNFVADALSRGLLDIVWQHVPTLRVHTFIPPHVSLGAVQQ